MSGELTRRCTEIVRNFEQFLRFFEYKIVWISLAKTIARIVICHVFFTCCWPVSKWNLPYGVETMGETKIVIFSVGPESYGLPIESVERIMNEVPVTRIPRTPAMLRGVFDLRGTTLPVLDLRLRFDMESTKDEKTFVIVQSGELRVALVVDSVQGIEAIESSEIEPAPEGWALKDDPFLSGIAKTNHGLVALLDSNFVVPKAIRDRTKKLDKSAA